jgi:hypothetical protein
LAPEQENWPLNYFNYFTEAEEAFQKARGTGLFLLSPLDWALIETWKDAGIPLEAVLRGIQAAFEKWHASRVKSRKVNSLAYCTQAVLEEAERMAGGLPVSEAKAPAEAPFSLEDLRRFLGEALGKLSGSVRETVAGILQDAEAHYAKLDELEQRLSALEDKMLAVARAQQTENDLFEARASLEAQLRPYRGKMTAPQLVMLEKQYLDRWLFEKAGLPRLSLFYLR